MCLILKTFSGIPEPEIAETDIPCHKLLDKDRYADGYLSSPFRGEMYRLGEEVVADCFGTECVHKSGRLNGRYVIEHGIHTYCHDIAANSANRLYFNGFGVVVKCVIPKGTRYYKGRNEVDGFDSYASEKIIVGNEIE